MPIPVPKAYLETILREVVKRATDDEIRLALAALDPAFRERLRKLLNTIDVPADPT